MQNQIPKNWLELKFGEVATLHRGYDLPIDKMTNGDYPVIFSNGKIEHHNNYKIKGPGVITGRSGSLGNTFYIESDYWPHNTTLYVSDFHGNDPKFIYYLFKTLNFSFLNAGSGVPTLNRNHVHQIPLKIPADPKMQKQIAFILSAFDDKIEVNNKIAKNLEEMAQALFKEWFVHFRFPGYEKVKMTNSPFGKIPGGWYVVKIADLVERISSGKQYDNETVKAIGLVPVLDQGKSGIIGYHDYEPGVKANEDNPIIVFANHTCYQRLIHFSFSAIQNVLPFVPNKANFRNIYWLHYATKDLVEFNDYKGHWPEFMSKKLLLPEDCICKEFGAIIKPIEILIFKLEKENTKLRQTRDLILPKLMRGEIRV